MVSACGFEPMYGKQSASGQALFSGVLVETTTAGRIGQQLRIALEDELNPGAAASTQAAYRLVADIKHSEAGIDSARDGTVSRYNVYLISDYKLYRVSDGALMTSGNLRHVSSYSNITNQYFSTYVAAEDGLRRGLLELSKLYRQRLATYITQNDGRPLPQKPKEKPTDKKLPRSSKPPEREAIFQ